MHNLMTVVSFEFLRTLRKRTFWIGTLAIPVVMAGFIALMVFSTGSTSVSLAAQKDADISFSYQDASGYITDDVAGRYGGDRTEDRGAAIESVRTGEIDAYFEYPDDPATTPVEVFATDSGVFDNGKYATVAEQLLVAGVTDTIGSPSMAAIAGGNADFAQTLFKDGEISPGALGIVPPLAFVAMFYLIILFTGNQTIASTLEEKENRVTEMIMTAVAPTTLLVGKVIALTLVAAVQLASFAIPGVLGFIVLAPRLGGGAVPLEVFAPEPTVMLTAVVLLAGGLFFFTATLVALGAAIPTAKEANNAFSVVAVLMLLPLYAATLTGTNPDSPVVQVLTYFPITAPSTALLRNGFGTLSTPEAAIVAAILFIGGALVFALAVRIFRHGPIGNDRGSLRAVLSR